MTTEILDVIEYNEDNFAIIEDSKGKYLVTGNSPDMIPLGFPKCYLTDPDRQRQAMLT